MKKASVSKKAKKIQGVVLEGTRTIQTKRNDECKKENFFWENHPQHNLGSHDGKSDLKRDSTI